MQKKTKIFKWSVPKLDGGWPLTPVDSAALLEKVLLHELSHTNSAGQNVDVCLPVHVPGTRLTDPERSAVAPVPPSLARAMDGMNAGN